MTSKTLKAVCALYPAFLALLWVRGSFQHRHLLGMTEYVRVLGQSSEEISRHLPNFIKAGQ